MPKMVLNEKDFNDLLKDRSLMEAMLNPKYLMKVLKNQMEL